MIRLRSLGLAALLTPLACSSGPKDLGNRFPGPGAVAAFAGKAAKRAEQPFQPYVAVASTRGDELAIVDPEEGTIVTGPGGIFPLSVPTVSDRPTRLVATPLEEEPDPARRAGSDLLIAVGAGSLRLEVLDTWSGLWRIDGGASVDLALDPAVGSSAILGSLAAAPVPGTPGRARVFAALSGSRMAVVEFERVGEAIRHRATSVRGLGFEAADVAVAPGGRLVFCASGDPVGPQVFGVAQIDVPADPAAPWTFTALDARAPTIRVAAAMVRERLRSSTLAYEDTARLEVFAVLEPAACGARFPINCGLATLLPDAGLAPDPAGELDHRAPIPLPGLPSALAVLEPPLRSTAVPPTVPISGNPGDGTTAALAVVTRIGPAATGETGSVYFVDLARWAMASGSSLMVGGSRVRVSGAAWSADPVGKPRLTLASPEAEPGTGRTVFTGPAIDPGDPKAGAQLLQAVRVTPGYTSGDRWTVTWQGVLPDYGSTVARVGNDPVVGPWLAFQVPSGVSASGPDRWKALRRITTELGLRPGDLAEAISSQPDCLAVAEPVQSGFRSRIVALLPPDPEKWPGGAVALEDLGCLAADPGILRGETVEVLGAIRASELVLVGTAFGYAGRPTLNPEGGTSPVPYAVRWRPEAGLGPEELTIVRKARRREYPASPACSVATSTDCNPIPDPLAPGPLVEFAVRQWNNGAPTERPQTGSQIVIDTSGGVSPISRVPPSGASGPTGVAVVDHSVFPGREAGGLHLYVSYADDKVGLVVPGGSGSLDRVVR